jgi:RND superfamily putative drug exporter
MKLLGDRNWYLPRWLRWLPNIRIEGEPARGRQRPLATIVAPTEATVAD